MGFLYVKSVPGILKIIEEIFNFIAFMCVVTSYASPKATAFLIASAGAFIITLILLIIRVSNIDQKILAPWHKIEFGYCIIWSVFYLITSALVIDFTGIDPYVAGGCFGLFATVTYLVDAYDKFKTGD